MFSRLKAFLCRQTDDKITAVDIVRQYRDEARKEAEKEQQICRLIEAAEKIALALENIAKAMNK